MIKSHYIHDLRSIINYLQNYDSNNNIFIENKDLKDICENKSSYKKIKKLNLNYHFKIILHNLLYYIYHHYPIDIKFMKYMYYLIFVNQNIDFFVENVIPHLQICKQNFSLTSLN